MHILGPLVFNYIFYCENLVVVKAKLFIIIFLILYSRRREGRNSLEPLHGRDPWDGRERDRERDPRERERDPRDREREMHEREREMREREQDRRRGYEREDSRPPGPSIKGRDWETRDYTDSRREWDGRGRQVYFLIVEYVQ